MKNMIQIALGSFFFSISTAAYEQLQRTTHYQWASHSRLGSTMGKRAGVGGPAYQFIGPGDESLSLTGTIYTEYQGFGVRLSLASLRLLRLLADKGIPLPLVSTGGLIFGCYIIESIDEKSSLFLNDGTPKKIEFTLSLKRYNENVNIIDK